MGVGGVGACTLLGPEGPDTAWCPSGCGVGMVSLQAFIEAGGCWWGWGFWPSVENYIVDASILDSMSSDVGSQGESPVGCLSGCPVGVFTGQFRIRAFGFGCTNSIELM